MKFHFENLGLLDDANLELSDLTVICGLNNTGKTYVTYATYALLSGWRRLVEWDISPTNKRALQENGILKVDLQKEFVEKWDQVRIDTAAKWKDFLPFALAAPTERFAETKLSFDFPITSVWIEQGFESESTSEQGKIIFTAKKPEGSSEIEIVALRETYDTTWPQFALEDFVRQVMLDAVLGPFLPNVFMASAERTGAAIFKDELNLTKNKIVGLLSQLEKDKAQHITPTALFDAVYKRGYALPVDDNVRFVNRLQALEDSRGKLIARHPELRDDFRDITGGEYVTNKDGNTHFIPSGAKRGTKLALTEASSAVRSLLVLWYWLNGLAAKGDFLMIDEPELNLHPVNQRKMARFLVKLVNLGVKVFVTTHSDYIVKEFNTLIMLNRGLPHFSGVRDRFGYGVDERLSPDAVKLYMTANTGTKKKPMRTLKLALIYPELGLEVESFDDSIEEINSIQDEIRYGGE